MDNLNTCLGCGDQLHPGDPNFYCQECLALESTNLDDHDPTLTEFDSVEDWVQQSLNEELGLE